MTLVFHLHIYIYRHAPNKNQELKFLFLSLAKIIRVLTCVWYNTHSLSFLDMQIDLSAFRQLFSHVSAFKSKITHYHFPLVYSFCTLYCLNKTKMIRFGVTYTILYDALRKQSTCIYIVCIAAVAERWLDALLDSNLCVYWLTKGSWTHIRYISFNDFHWI